MNLNIKITYSNLFACCFFFGMGSGMASALVG